jgi:GTP-binding protein
MSSFVDEVRVRVEAGRGGDGIVAWRRESKVPRGGPAGGDGGNGGDVVFIGDRQLSTLLDLRYRQRLNAESGKPGMNKGKNGRGGATLEVHVPVGTMVYVTEGDPEPEEEDAPRVPEPGTLLGDLTEDGQRLVVASGGHGGRGNVHFRSSTNRSPTYAEPGTLGQRMWLRLELKLLADVGIVGFPNVGKSTLISRISRARPKIADYPFTTLVPNLGVVSLGTGRSMVVADVPGLIPGASEGRGLGLRFLRHLERTQVLLHLLALDPDPQREPLSDLDAIEAELVKYGARFEQRPRVVALNKVDSLGDPAGEAVIADLRAELRKRNIPLFPISAHTGVGVDALLEAIWRRLDAIRRAEPIPEP